MSLDIDIEKAPAFGIIQYVNRCVMKGEGYADSGDFKDGI
jgi:hypothetical protein